jgi:tRNA (cytidine/uridine-2'-O-)-methyltransferase
MFNVILFNPQIPQNTGNIIRLCANTGCSLHLIEPLGFAIDNSRMRRSGLDYHEFASMKIYSSWAHFLDKNPNACHNIYALTTHGNNNLLTTNFKPHDYFLFGSETSGLPSDIRDAFDAEHKMRLPMMPDNRSLNLANTVSIIVFEAWRQQGFLNGF